ncbi:hepatitis A virus cellular receptor 2 homolog [Neolamprologus brichardi]|uniref:hepatitis A virus cellular receptor 2 homolog n=1 Tax=Neolamprologus brichardi TaxID=32507 RepID=UPI001643F99D|nr:hepatitis A virus cellular receptor 2 homolog [Neolamprologus brichardi]
MIRVMCEDFASSLRLIREVSQHASGVEVYEVYEGEESVLLPCQVPVNVSSSSTAVVWDRDEFKIPTVHMRVQSGDDILNDQNHRYTNRTSMKANALQIGDLSLTLRNPTVSDGGTYTCIVRKYGQDQSKAQVQLKVKERPPTWPWVLSGILAILALLARKGNPDIPDTQMCVICQEKLANVNMAK